MSEDVFKRLHDNMVRSGPAFEKLGTRKEYTSPIPGRGMTENVAVDTQAVSNSNKDREKEEETTREKDAITRIYQSGGGFVECPICRKGIAYVKSEVVNKRTREYSKEKQYERGPDPDYITVTVAWNRKQPVVKCSNCKCDVAVGKAKLTRA